LSTLSCGECQRIKLASELHKQASIYVLDEPTTGLHMSDITHLIEIMNRLVEGGNTVIVIEHNLDVISSADWIIDRGPEGGNKGGQIIFEGTPKELLGAKQSLTSKYLKQGELTSGISNSTRSVDIQRKCRMARSACSPPTHTSGCLHTGSHRPPDAEHRISCRARRPPALQEVTSRILAFALSARVLATRFFLSTRTESPNSCVR